MSWGAQVDNANCEVDKIKIFQHQYDTIVLWYKHHTELILKANTFTYAITGALLSYYLSKPNEGVFKYTLYFPCIMNLVYGIFFLIAARHIWPFDKDLRRIIHALGLMSGPNIMFLKTILQISGFLYLIVAVGLSLIPIFR